MNASLGPPPRLLVFGVLVLAILGLAGCEPSGLSDDPPVEPDPVEPMAVGDAGTGRAIIADVGCGVCHRIPGIAGAIGIVGPPLAGVASRPLIAGTEPNRPEILVRFIENPPALVPNTAMPALPITRQEARHIAAYLTTLR